MRHSAIFTMRGEEEVIKITDPSIAVVQANCVRCHNSTNDKVSTRSTVNGQVEEKIHTAIKAAA